MKKSQILGPALGLLIGLLFPLQSVRAENAQVLYQQVDDEGQGMTVMRVWGSHYEMGYGMGSTMAEEIVDGVAEARSLAGLYYNTLRSILDNMLWRPVEVDDE